MRQYLLSVIAISLWEYPLLQIANLNIINLSFICYTIIAQPFADRFVWISNFGNELITEMAYFASLILGIYDYIDENDYEKRMTCGWIIIYANLILLYWMLASAIMRPLFIFLYQKWSKRRHLKKGKIVPAMRETTAS